MIGGYAFHSQTPLLWDSRAEFIFGIASQFYVMSKPRAQNCCGLNFVLPQSASSCSQAQGSLSLGGGSETQLSLKRDPSPVFLLRLRVWGTGTVRGHCDLCTLSPEHRGAEPPQPRSPQPRPPQPRPPQPRSPQPPHEQQPYQTEGKEADKRTQKRKTPDSGHQGSPGAGGQRSRVRSLGVWAVGNSLRSATVSCLSSSLPEGVHRG